MHPSNTSTCMFNNFKGFVKAADYLWQVNIYCQFFTLDNLQYRDWREKEKVLLSLFSIRNYNTDVNCSPTMFL